jgi:hypothetical protein
LVDGHLGCVTMNELNEATALARRDLDVCNFAKALEERPELIFSDIAGQTTNENSSVVGVRELVHLSGGIETTISEASLLLHSTPHLLLRHASAHHGVTVLALTEAVVIVTAESISDLHLNVLWNARAHRFLGVAVEMRMGRLPQYTPCISTRARCWSFSSEKRTKP